MSKTQIVTVAILEKAIKSSEERLLHAMSEIVTEILKNVVTKEEAKHFATKDDLKKFATKDDLKNFVTKDDLKQLKSEILGPLSETMGELLAIREENTVITHQYQRLSTTVDRLSKHVSLSS